MVTLNNIYKQIENVPIDRLEEVYEFVQSLTPNTLQPDDNCKKILSFGGAFSDMSKKDYKEFQIQNKKTRAGLFDRNINL